jgi:hypothetical protein
MSGFSAVGELAVGELAPATAPMPEPPTVAIDASSVPLSRVVVFGGGVRTVVFNGGIRTVEF